ncbi:MAG: hypothetical protein ABSG31_16590 [Tepidisphaeraceae bacterium]
MNSVILSLVSAKVVMTMAGILLCLATLALAGVALAARTGPKPVLARIGSTRPAVLALPVRSSRQAIAAARAPPILNSSGAVRRRYCAPPGRS